MRLFMLKSPDLIYIVTRAHGLRTHLLKLEDISALIKVPDFPTIVEALLKGDYAQDVSAIPSERMNAISLTEVFYKKLADRFYFIVRITGRSLKKFFEDYAKRLEVDNIKRILRVKHGKETITEEALIPIPREYTTVNFPAMVGAKDLDESVGLLKETIYASLIDKIDLYKRHNTTLIFEGALESVYFKALWSDIEELPEKDDIKDIIGKEMDLKNLILALGLKAKNLPVELVEASLITLYYKLRKTTITRLVQERPESTFDVLMGTHYARYFQGLRDSVEKNMVSDIEHSILNSLFHENLKVMHEKPLKLAFVLAYLYFCENEAKNMTTLVTGRQLGLSEEKLKSILFL
ncbi:MAG: V-type ATPase subunit [archaeon]|nr:V-type ATPase subunit [archaeon]